MKGFCLGRHPGGSPRLPLALAANLTAKSSGVSGIPTMGAEDSKPATPSKVASAQLEEVTTAPAVELPKMTCDQPLLHYSHIDNVAPH